MLLAHTIDGPALITSQAFSTFIHFEITIIVVCCETRKQPSTSRCVTDTRFGSVYNIVRSISFQSTKNGNEGFERNFQHEHSGEKLQGAEIESDNGHGVAPLNRYVHRSITKLQDLKSTSNGPSIGTLVRSTKVTVQLNTLATKRSLSIRPRTNCQWRLFDCHHSQSRTRSRLV